MKLIKKIYAKLVPIHIRYSISSKLLGKKVYDPLKKGENREFVYIHIPKTGGTSVAKKIGFVEHRTAREVREILGNKKWEKVFKFAFVRNPWELVYSHYRFKVKNNHQNMKDDPIEFNDWVKRIYGSNKDVFYYYSPKMFQQQYDWLKDNEGQLDVDFVGNFSSLSEDYKKVANIIGINEELPHLNKTGSKSTYKESYSKESIELVEKGFSKDIEYWKFRFDD